MTRRFPPPTPLHAGVLRGVVTRRPAFLPPAVHRGGGRSASGLQSAPQLPWRHAPRVQVAAVHPKTLFLVIGVATPDPCVCFLGCGFAVPEDSKQVTNNFAINLFIFNIYIHIISFIWHRQEHSHSRSETVVLRTLLRRRGRHLRGAVCDAQPHQGDDVGGRLPRRDPHTAGDAEARAPWGKDDDHHAAAGLHLLRLRHPGA